MDVFDAIKKRRSVRRFKEKEVEEEKIAKILDAFFWAPSAGNLQSRDIVVVKEKDLKEKLSKASFDQDFIRKSPVVFVVCANKKKALPYGERGTALYCLQDAAASVQNMLVVAYSLGLGSCWVGAFSEEQVGRVLGLPSFSRTVAIVPVGYPDENPASPRRERIIHSEAW